MRLPPARRLVAFAVLTIVCIGCDQVTKQTAALHLRNAEPITTVGGLVRLQYAENPGAFLGLGDRLTDSARFWIFGVLTAALLAAIAAIVLRRRDLDRRTFVALSLVLAGGLGNLVDRLSDGFVVDFLNVGIGPVRTGIFNVADVAITGGAVALLVLSFRARSATGTAG